MIKHDVTESLSLEGIKPQDIGPGVTVRANHYGCPAGIDTRQRLYVTRKQAPKDLLVAYCHNCGDGMGFKAKPRGHMSMPKTRGKLFQVEKLWSEGVPLIEAPDTVLSWAKAKGLLDCHSIDAWVKWHPLNWSVMFGIRPLGLELVGPDIKPPLAIQSRYFDGRIKWLTHKGDSWPVDEPVRTLLRIDRDDSRVVSTSVAIVEDYTSAQRLFGYTEVGELDTYCLFGASCSIDELAKLRHEHGYTELLVWLDNDVPAVVQSREDIARRAKLVGFTDVRIERDFTDPKLCHGDLLIRKFKEYPRA
jgi:hypothetical protein